MLKSRDFKDTFEYVLAYNLQTSIKRKGAENMKRKKL